MIEGLIYFAGPRSRWAGKVDEAEIIARFHAPWIWLIRGLVLVVHRQMDASRCGYVIVRNGEIVEHYDP